MKILRMELVEQITYWNDNIQRNVTVNVSPFTIRVEEMENIYLYQATYLSKENSRKLNSNDGFWNTHSLCSNDDQTVNFVIRFRVFLTKQDFNVGFFAGYNLETKKLELAKYEEEEKVLKEHIRAVVPNEIKSDSLFVVGMVMNDVDVQTARAIEKAIIETLDLENSNTIKNGVDVHNCDQSQSQKNLSAHLKEMCNFKNIFSQAKGYGFLIRSNQTKEKNSSETIYNSNFALFNSNNQKMILNQLKDYIEEYCFSEIYYPFIYSSIRFSDSILTIHLNHLTSADSGYIAQFVLNKTIEKYLAGQINQNNIMTIDVTHLKNSNIKKFKDKSEKYRTTLNEKNKEFLQTNRDIRLNGVIEKLLPECKMIR